MKHHAAFLLFLSAVLSGCSGTNLQDKIPDRRPDYRQSHIGRTLEIPPDLTGSAVNDRLNIPDTAGGTVNYRQENQLKRNSRGYLEVLPPLYGVSVSEIQGQLPYILVAADPATTWAAVKKYWESNGIRLKRQEPAIGLMETDWLENLADLPRTGISGLLDSLITMTHDSGKRDRYRVRLSRAANGQTAVTLIYMQAKEKALKNSNSKDPEGFRWQLSDTDNPEIQLEMTRRLALFISAQLQHRQASAEVTASKDQGITSARLIRLNGQPALDIALPYARAWEILGNGLTKNGFVTEDQDYTSGTYQIHYQPQTATDKNTPIHCLIRLADHGNHTVAVVQNTTGKTVSAREAQALLETLLNAM